MPAQIQAEFYHTVGPSASNNTMPGPPLHVGDDVYQYAEDAWEGEAVVSQVGSNTCTLIIMYSTTL